MNLVSCCERCVHQRDGYCTLNGLEEPVESALSDQCPYFLNDVSECSEPERKSAEKTELKF